MNSRIFVVATKKEIKEGNYYIPDGTEVVGALSHVDYCSSRRLVKKKDEDIEWFKNFYGAKTLSTYKEILGKWEELIPAYKINAEEFKKALKNQIKRILGRVEEVIKELKSGITQEKVFDRINYILQSEKEGFYFYKKDIGFIPDVDFLWYLENTDLKKEDLYIIGIIEYHMHEV